MNGSTQPTLPLKSREQLESTEMKLNKKRPKVLETTSPRRERSTNSAAIHPIESRTRFSSADHNVWEETHGDTPKEEMGVVITCADKSGEPFGRVPPLGKPSCRGPVSEPSTQLPSDLATRHPKSFPHMLDATARAQTRMDGNPVPAGPRSTPSLPHHGGGGHPSRAVGHVKQDSRGGHPQAEEPSPPKRCQGGPPP
jgi:hypothetical protein